jgi:hypothetical protein
VVKMQIRVMNFGSSRGITYMQERILFHSDECGVQVHIGNKRSMDYTYVYMAGWMSKKQGLYMYIHDRLDIVSVYGKAVYPHPGPVPVEPSKMRTRVKQGSQPRSRFGEGCIRGKAPSWFLLINTWRQASDTYMAKGRVRHGCWSTSHARALVNYVCGFTFSRTGRRKFH